MCTLIVADLHLGKAAHFRKSGIAISTQVHLDDLNRLNILLGHYRPSRVLFLGDLFHSSLNGEWKAFLDWRTRHSHINMTLVAGNHDILPAHSYKALEVEQQPLTWGPYIFSHAPMQHIAQEGLYNICGHIHPKVRLRASARQHLAVDCFYMNTDQALLPAFGIFTGGALVQKLPTAQVFAICDEEIITL
jgi:DNA ligase-associated metallophosphoesterase